MYITPAVKYVVTVGEKKKMVKIEEKIKNLGVKSGSVQNVDLLMIVISMIVLIYMDKDFEMYSKEHYGM